MPAIMFLKRMRPPNRRKKLAENAQVTTCRPAGALGMQEICVAMHLSPLWGYKLAKMPDQQVLVHIALLWSA